MILLWVMIVSLKIFDIVIVLYAIMCIMTSWQNKRHYLSSIQMLTYCVVLLNLNIIKYFVIIQFFSDSDIGQLLRQL